MSELHGKRVVLGVTGGVAAYKAAELARLLVKAGAEIDVVLTDAGAHFVGAPTFQAITGRPVWHNLWDSRMDNAPGKVLRANHRPCHVSAWLENQPLQARSK